jgi:hypothetical protein
MGVAKRVGYNPDKVRIGLQMILDGSLDQKQIVNAVRAAIHFVDAEGRAVELATGDSNQARKALALNRGDALWHSRKPEYWYDEVRAERRALNDGDEALYTPQKNVFAKP